MIPTHDVEVTFDRLWSSIDTCIDENMPFGLVEPFKNSIERLVLLAGSLALRSAGELVVETMHRLAAPITEDEARAEKLYEEFEAM